MGVESLWSLYFFLSTLGFLGLLVLLAFLGVFSAGTAGLTSGNQDGCHTMSFGGALYKVWEIFLLLTVLVLLVGEFHQLCGDSTHCDHTCVNFIGCIHHVMIRIDKNKLKRRAEVVNHRVGGRKIIVLGWGLGTITGAWAQ